MALELAQLEEKSVDDLHELAKELSVEDHEKLRKPDLVLRIMRAQAEQNGLIRTQGVLEILREASASLRVRNFLPSQDDIYVSQSQVKRFGLKTGDTVVGAVRMPKSGERYRSLLKLEAVKGLLPDAIRKPTHFD